MNAADRIALQEAIDRRNESAARADRRKRAEARERALAAKPDPEAARYFARLRGAQGPAPEDDE